MSLFVFWAKSAFQAPNIVQEILLNYIGANYPALRNSMESFRLSILYTGVVPVMLSGFYRRPF
jgi:hypothetical protein